MNCLMSTLSYQPQMDQNTSGKCGLTSEEGYILLTSVADLAVLGFLVSERSGSGSTLVALYFDASSLAPEHLGVQGWKLVPK